MVASLMLERCGELDRSNSIVTFLFGEMKDATESMGAYVMHDVIDVTNFIRRIKTVVVTCAM